MFLCIESGLEQLTGNAGRGPISSVLRRLATLGVVCIGWIFFRADSIHAAIGILRRIMGNTSLTRASLQGAVLAFSNDSSAFAVGTVAALFILVMFAIELISVWDLADLSGRIFSSPYYEALATAAIFQAVMFFGIMRSSAFIYFQF